MLIPFVLIAIVSGLVIGIPSLIVVQIIHKLLDPTLPVILSFSLDS